MNKKQEEQKDELHHEPKPGYRPAFFIILIVAVIYLAFVFLRALI